MDYSITVANCDSEVKKIHTMTRGIYYNFSH